MDGQPAEQLPQHTCSGKKEFPFFRNPVQWASVRILRHWPYIGLASLLFVSCGKKQEAGTTGQPAQPAQVDAPPQPADQAVAFIKLQAEEGIRDAQYKYAYHLATGLGIAQDSQEARTWFQKAATQGHTEAQFRLAQMHLQGVEDGVAKPADAAQWFLKAANSGHADAQFQLARLCLDGKGVVQDDSKAFAWFRLAAQQGNPAAQFQLGRLHESGQGTPIDLIAAYSWFEKAARLGHAGAQYKAGLMARDGTGTTQDADKADHWFSLAQAQGIPRPEAPASTGTVAEAGPTGPHRPLPRPTPTPEPPAKLASAAELAAKPQTPPKPPPSTKPETPQREFLTTPGTAQQFEEEQRKEKTSLANVEFEVANSFAHGGPIPADPQKAREYYLRAAEKGHAESLHKLGMEYLAPPGAQAPDPANAVLWLERAAAQGHAGSQHQLGEIYLSGVLGPPDHRKAYWWHWLAASNNRHPASQNRIGEMYMGGLGVDKNPQAAAEWFEKAAAQGNASAAQHLRAIHQAAQAKADAQRTPPTLSPDAWLEKGLRLYRGQPTAEAYREAYQCFSNAALGGNKTAHYYIGLMLDYGQGFQPNPEKAFENYLVAARDGFARAQFNLGFLYESGRGTRKLSTEAYVWYTLAGENGMEKAIRTRDELARKMKPYQVSYAQQRLGMLKKLLAGQ